MNKLLDVLLAMMMFVCVIGMAIIILVAATMLLPDLLMAINECFAVGR